MAGYRIDGQAAGPAFEGQRLAAQRGPQPQPGQNLSVFVHLLADQLHPQKQGTSHGGAERQFGAGDGAGVYGQKRQFAGRAGNRGIRQVSIRVGQQLRRTPISHHRNDSLRIPRCFGPHQQKNQPTRLQNQIALPLLSLT